MASTEKLRVSGGVVPRRSRRQAAGVAAGVRHVPSQIRPVRCRMGGRGHNAPTGPVAQRGPLTARLGGATGGRSGPKPRTSTRTRRRPSGTRSANFIKPQWGETPSTRSSSVTCSHGLTGYAGTAGPSYVRDIYGVVRSSMGVAVKRGGLTADPCSAITLSKVTKKPKVFPATTNLPAIAAELEQPWRDTIEFMH
jgi:hypothetical protein